MHSIVLRTDRVVADSTKPYTVRLEQIYTPSLDLPRTVSAHVTLRKRPTPPAQGQPQQEPPLVKDLGTFDGVSRDLRESPFPFELDLHDVADGGYLLVAEVNDQATSLGAATLGVALAQRARRDRRASRERRGEGAGISCAPRSCSRSIG